MRTSLLLTIAVAALGQSPPRVFFTDLESGPNSGGQANAGVFVTIWGLGFGGARGSSTVTVGGGAAASYPIWTDRKITIQLGAAARTGPLVVNTSAGTSNGIPFTVRAGNIYFVATNGNDSADGSFERPWRTLARATNALRAGDTAYVRDGVTEVTEDIYSAALSVTTGGQEGRPVALVAYPGARVTIGGPRLELGLRIPNIEEAAGADHWVLSQMTLRASVSALSLEGPSPSSWRVVGNDISCPDGDGQTGCFVTSLGRNIKFLGNEIHDTGRAGASKQYHAAYFTTDTNQVEVGWNYIHDNRTCRAVQFHSSPLCEPSCGAGDTTGFNQYDLVVHDNLIRGDICDGIVFATVDPSRGRVEAFNNLIVKVGTGPHPPDDPASYACVAVPGYTNTGADGAGVVEVYHNTCYDFGSVDAEYEEAGAFVRGEYSPRLQLNLRNNVSYALSRQRYIADPTNRITGSNNLWFGAGSGPGGLRNNINADPLFVSPAGLDFHLRAGSPAIDAGMEVALAWDFDGTPRPQGRARDAGAFEWISASGPGPGPGPVPRPAANSAANGFSFEGGAVSPGEIVSLFGQGLGPATGAIAEFSPAGRLPTALGGVSVACNGVAAPLFFARADQVNAQVPYEVAGAREAAFVVSYQGQSSEALRLPLQATHPGLFPGVFDARFASNSAQNPAAPGDVVILFATGLGVTDPPSPSGAMPGATLPAPVAELRVEMGGRAARVEFAGRTPGTAGVTQIHLRVPDGLAAGSHAVALQAGSARDRGGVRIVVR